MVDVHSVPESDVGPVHRKLCERVGHRDEATVREWYGDHPELFVGAYNDGDVVGFALGRAGTDSSVELVGTAVDDSHTRRGIGSVLLDGFEDAVADLGYDRVSLGSAGGYVDEFYLTHGYEPESILVQLHPDDVPAEHDELGFEILRKRDHNGFRKLYVEPGGHDPERVEAVREAFGDPDAIYIMEKWV